MSSSDKLPKFDLSHRALPKPFYLPPRLDFSRFISDEDVESILQTTNFRRSKSNSRGRFLHQTRERAGLEGRKKAKTPSPAASPHKYSGFRGKGSESDMNSQSGTGSRRSVQSEEYVKALAARCEDLEGALAGMKAVQVEERLDFQRGLAALAAELANVQGMKTELEGEIKLLTKKAADRAKAMQDLAFFLIDLLQNLLENKVLSTSRLQSIASSFDSSLEAGLPLEDEEKRRAGEQIRDLLREKLVGEMAQIEGLDTGEVTRRIEQWTLPTPNSSTWEVRSSNKSATSSRTDSFVLYPEAVVSFRNLSNSPDLCLSPTFQQPEQPNLLGSSFSFESLDQPKVEEAGSPEPRETVALALYDFQGERSEDLSFQAGQRIAVLSQNPSGWWTGRSAGQEGVFPFNYVELQ